MAWETKVLNVLAEHKKRNGDLGYKYEITRSVNEAEGKQFERGFQKTGYYQKGGDAIRGYPQPLTKYDLAWVRDHWSDIQKAIDPPPESETKPETPPAAASTAAVDSDIEEVPF